LGQSPARLRPRGDPRPVAMEVQPRARRLHRRVRDRLQPQGLSPLGPPLPRFTRSALRRSTMKLFNRLPALLVAALFALGPAVTLLVASEARAQAPATDAAKPADAAPKAAAPAPTPPAGAGEPGKEGIENPYGLEALR